MSLPPRMRAPTRSVFLAAVALVALAAGACSTGSGGTPAASPTTPDAAEPVTSTLTASGTMTDTAGTPETPAPTANATQKAVAANFTYPILGSEDALVTIYEFSDYRCPFCRQFATETLPELQKEFIDNGGPVAVRFVDFPLQAHGYPAVIAAEAAHCAGEQGAYWTMHEAIFSQFAEMNDLPLEESPETVDFLVELAGDKGLDSAAVRACVESQRYRPTIGAEYKQAIEADVNVTPTLVVGQRVVLGFVEWPELKKIVEEEIALALGTPIATSPPPDRTPEASGGG